ncbi:hypothetical protein [Halopenitus malekzadehii]|uniref:hypothetical protein n=1 Tax=Halopenitus malekzadehii TaxID=1267564 RepID=UPI00115F8736|nr:hypothetical protein [Halopenitus malekzadehii]
MRSRVAIVPGVVYFPTVSWRKSASGAIVVTRSWSDATTNDASVLCTGLNPGFALDTLVVALTAVSESIDAIEASRTVDFSPYGAGVLEPGGFGLAPDEWTRRRDAGDLAGHESFQN